MDQSQTNPWSNVTSDALNQFNTSLNAGISKIPQYDQNMNQQMSMYAAQAAYPTFPNESGIGSQLPFSTAAPTSDSNKQLSITDRGISPYSLVGEGNTR